MVIMSVIYFEMVQQIKHIYIQMRPVASTELYFLASLAGGGRHVTRFWPVEYPE